MRADEGAVRRRADPGHGSPTRTASATPRRPTRPTLCQRLLDDAERTILEAGPETVRDADRRAGAERRRLPRSRAAATGPAGALCDQYGIALVADEVITGFGRIGEWFASARYGVAPDLITCAKGITSAYAPMGAVLVSDRIAEPLYEDGRMLMHGITFAGPSGGERDRAAQHRDLRARRRARERPRAGAVSSASCWRASSPRVPMVADVRGAGFFWALELVRDAEESRFSAEEREKLLRGFLAGRLLEEGLIARPTTAATPCCTSRRR